MNEIGLIPALLIGLAVGGFFIWLDRRISAWYLEHRRRHGDDGLLQRWLKRRRERDR